MKLNLEKCIKDGVEQAMSDYELTIGMTVKEAVWNSPTVDPVRHGEWVIDGYLIKCSQCGFGMFKTGYYFVNGECVSANDRKYMLHYCPHCGAKMDGGEQ
ncbi:MAG: hypothetical protein KH354_03875 [Clostridiales bacterium]|nr:hypothetical protein [Clostridiales bacterium]